MNKCEHCGLSIYQAEIHSKNECVAKLREDLHWANDKIRRLENKIYTLMIEYNIPLPDPTDR